MTLVGISDLVRGLSRSEKDDLEDGALTYDQISPLDKAKTLSHEVGFAFIQLFDYYLCVRGSYLSR